MESSEEKQTKCLEIATCQRVLRQHAHEVDCGLLMDRKLKSKHVEPKSSPVRDASSVPTNKCLICLFEVQVEVRLVPANN